MKKAFVGSILAALATVILCVCLTACANGNIVGTYKFESMKGTQAGIEINYKVGDEFMAGAKITEDFMVLTIKDDNTFTMTAFEQDVEGTWKEEGGKYYLTIAGEDQEVTLKGNKLIMEQDGNKVTFKK